MFFPCKHPFKHLVVTRKATFVSLDKDFNKVTYYFTCLKCGENLELKHAVLNKPVEDYLKR